jgi:hypothetical protein
MNIESSVPNKTSELVDAIVLSIVRRSRNHSLFLHARAWADETGLSSDRSRHGFEIAS